MEFRTPWDPRPVAPSLPPAPPSPPKRLGRRPTASRTASVAASSPWLYHHLTISGPDEVITSFAEAARGSGIVPWRLEAARLEEDIFNLAASQPGAIRSLTIDGCRILARQFRERVEDRAARAAARVGRSRACPFDLHTLLPVPAAVLDLGPSHPQAQAWLATDLYSVAEARDRILRMLGEGCEGEELRHFLPEDPATGAALSPPEKSLRLSSAWATTFSASLELAKQGDVALEQRDSFKAVHVSRPTKAGPYVSS